MRLKLAAALLVSLCSVNASASAIFSVCVFNAVMPNDVATNETYVDTHTADITFDATTIGDMDDGAGGLAAGATTIFDLVSGFATNYAGSATEDLAGILRKQLCAARLITG